MAAARTVVLVPIVAVVTIFWLGVSAVRTAASHVMGKPPNRPGQ